MPEFTHRFISDCLCFGTGEFRPTTKYCKSCSVHDREGYLRMLEEPGGVWAGVDHDQDLFLGYDTSEMQLVCAWVDELMVPYIELMYDYGFSTYFSCQGDEVNDGYLYGRDDDGFTDVFRSAMENEVDEIEYVDTAWDNTPAIVIRWKGEIRRRND